ncbi:Dabb family protein [Rhodopirellula sp. SM50]|uniref:Stress responsive A/B Barrel Domain protein n=1 Tax=Stieleria magnilauensis TaxID=2527963 RepID=A0ABX5XQR2_9BACT|nr:Dabb family protein [Rhodopirellula sp. SM50]PAY18769.1 stress responsive protein [Rhodopirellula sp. SM50]QDV82966.1 Stress responsive A/B Barrel Domain protein [Planctomycetes bacterium TBK1r]
MARLAHHVFFTLKDNSPAAVDSLVADCQKYLDDHDGVIGFSVGRRDTELDRPVNVKFDVSLHVIFRDRATHDVYQTAPRHLEFIERQKENWATVQVCDSLLED